jgi:hypothetical protein
VRAQELGLTDGGHSYGHCLLRRGSGPQRASSEGLSLLLPEVEPPRGDPPKKTINRCEPQLETTQKSGNRSERRDLRMNDCKCGGQEDLRAISLPELWRSSRMPCLTLGSGSRLSRHSEHYSEPLRTALNPATAPLAPALAALHRCVTVTVRCHLTPEISKVKVVNDSASLELGRCSGADFCVEVIFLPDAFT